MNQSVRFLWAFLALGLASCGSSEVMVNEASPSAPAPDAGEQVGDAAGPAPQDAEMPRVATAVEDVMRLLAGRFDSRRQSQEQPSYFDVQLLGCPVDAPELGERVLYIEQAMRERSSEPYRQRLYVIEPGAEPARDAISRVYALEDPASFVGQCSVDTLRRVLADEAYEREGCQVMLRRDGEGFVGETDGASCRSTLRGASYATSEVSLQPERIDSWDRGYDAAGRQVWGATEGPYRFERQAP